MPERKLIWSNRAIENLEEIFAYFRERNGSHEYGNRLLQQIEEKLRHYLLSPLLGQQDGKSKRRFFVCGNYRIYYRFTKATFEVIKVWDGRRNPDDLRFDK